MSARGNSSTTDGRTFDDIIEELERTAVKLDARTKGLVDRNEEVVSFFR